MTILSRAFWCIVAAPVVLAWPNNASAMPSCEGTYAATLLQPLPERMVVGLDIRDALPRNQRLADRFLAGIREAGISTGVAPNITLHVSTSRLNEASAGSGRGIERSYSGLSGMEVGKMPSLPAMPSSRLSVPPTRQTLPMLFLRIDATERQETRISWVASVQCRPRGTDDGQLAQDLGRVIGRVLGKRIGRSALQVPSGVSSCTQWGIARQRRQTQAMTAMILTGQLPKRTLSLNAWLVGIPERASG